MSSVDGVCAGGPDHIFALIVQSNGEDYWSRVFRVSELLGAGAPPPKLEKIIEVHEWLTSIVRTRDGALIVSGDDGFVYELAAGASEPSKQEVSPGKALAAVRAIDDDVYALGSDGVFKRQGSSWTRESEPLGRLFGIARARDGALLACGSDGLHRGGSGSWQRMTLPTNQPLLDVFVASDGVAWVAGKGGALFRQSTTGDWEPIGQSTYDFHGLCEFAGHLYLAAGGAGVARLDETGGTIEIVKPTVTSYSVVSDGKHLVSGGDKIAIRFNGESWAGSRFD